MKKILFILLLNTSLFAINQKVCDYLNTEALKSAEKAASSLINDTSKETLIKAYVLQNNTELFINEFLTKCNHGENKSYISLFEQMKNLSQANQANLLQMLK